MSDAPRRIRLRRTKGWRLPPGAVSVARPGKWGNPFVIGKAVPMSFRDGLTPEDRQRYRGARPVPDAAEAVRLFRAYAVPEGFMELRGRDLACWCPLDRPCHADVLLALANETEGCGDA